MSLTGFEERRCGVREADYFLAVDGAGTPVLLLHGFPETHVCWQQIAPTLAGAHRVVAPDLRGYGASDAPAGGPKGEGYSKREMAGELVEVMEALGHARFAVVGHDRGGRVAFRMALDHPERVTRVALLNIVPTLDQFERMGAGPSLGYWPWFFLAQPSPFPERMLDQEPSRCGRSAVGRMVSMCSSVLAAVRRGQSRWLSGILAACSAPAEPSSHLSDALLTSREARSSSDGTDASL